MKHQGLHPGVSRRLVLGSALALIGCEEEGRSGASASPGPLTPLKRAAPFAVGASVTAAQTGDPDARALLLAQFSQITPGLEMKMERVLRDDGSLDFSGADAMARFAHDNGLGLHAHNLIWFTYRPASFERLKDDRTAFAKAYRDYIAAVAGRYRGQARGWDVVNEPVAEDGNGYRDCLWREAFGMDYVRRALDHAREADPGAVLFLNEYNLESNPAKLASFLRLVETLLKQGAPLTGLGTQMHMPYNLPLKGLAGSMRELAAFGLPVHVSELDVSTHSHLTDFTSRAKRLDAQARLVEAAAEALAALPARQRYAFTTWGLRDRDSWYRSKESGGSGDQSDSPLLFDDDGQPKPAAAAFVRAVSRRR